MSADRAGDHGSASSEHATKIQAPRFSSYQPNAAGSSTGSSHTKRSSAKSRRSHHHHAPSVEPNQAHRRQPHSPKLSKSRKRAHSTRKTGHRGSGKDATDALTMQNEDMAQATFDPHLFFTDTKGDRDALVYGQDRAKVPKFHRRSHWLVGEPGPSTQPIPVRIHSDNTAIDADASTSDMRSNADVIALDADLDDPFDPTRPYVKRDPRFEQVGGGPTSQVSTLSQLNRSKTRQRPTGLQDIPIELLHMILVMSHSAELPITCRFMRRACQQASAMDKVDFIMERWLQHYLGHVTKNRCRSKHKSCKRQFAALSQTGNLGWQDVASSLSTTDCDADMVQKAGLDVLSFAAEFGICTAAVIVRLFQSATASSLPRVFTTMPLASQSVRLPKRLFRHIEHFEYAQLVTQPRSDAIQRDDPTQAPPKKRRRRRNGIASEKPSGKEAAFPRWLAQLLLSLAPVPGSSESAKSTGLEAQGSLRERVGPVPDMDDMQLLFTMLHHYGANASSHSGYPLAMAVHRRSYSLVHLLLLFGADPGCKDGLAVQIAIRNGFLDIVRLFVTGPCLDADLPNSVSIPRKNGGPNLAAGATTSRLGDLHLRLGAPLFQLDQSHLRLAIQSRQWELVDYIWHEQQVSPDIACLRLIEKLKT